MHKESAEVVICGAGMAGIAAAYSLAVGHGLRRVLLLDERPPLSLTSANSTECYRNWWPGPGDAMVGLMNRSIDLLEAVAQATENTIALNRRGYLFVTTERERVAEFVQAAEDSAALGAGPARIHRGQADDPLYLPAVAEGWEGQGDGADVIVEQRLIRRHFPYLREETVAVLHARRCGWLSAPRLGNYLLEQALAHGARLRRARVSGVEVVGGAVRAVLLADGSQIATERFVNAAGPGFAAVGRMLGLELPVFCEPHSWVRLADPAGLVPADAPLLISMDPLQLHYSQAERAALPASSAGQELFPAGLHLRPAGTPEQPAALGLWTINTTPQEPTFPLAIDERHGGTTLRGLATMVPRLEGLLAHNPMLELGGGYYTKTAENRPLVGPTPLRGAYLLGALSGFGIMGALGFGELLAAHIAGTPLPAYAPAFLLSRYDDPAYQILLGKWGSSGQL